MVRFPGIGRKNRGLLQLCYIGAEAIDFFPPGIYDMGRIRKLCFSGSGDDCRSTLGKNGRNIRKNIEEESKP